MIDPKLKANLQAIVREYDLGPVLKTLGEIAADLLNVQRWILLPPLGFAQPLAMGSRPPLLEDADIPMGIPRGAKLN